MSRFGGGTDSETFNDVWFYDTLTNKWEELKCTGDIPSPRVNHAATLVDCVLFVFSGQSRLFGELLNDLYALDIKGTAAIS